jgi:CBS domain-containing protein
VEQAGKKIGEVKVNKYLVVNDRTLLRLDKAKVRVCSLSNEEAKDRGCKEQDKTEGRECEEIVLVYRPSGCVREKEEINLDETTTVKRDSLYTSKVTVGTIARTPVPTVLLSSRVSDVAEIMVKQNAGAAVVARDSEPLGMITERDIIERVVLANKDLHEIVAQQIMTAPLLTIDSDRTIEKALEIMHKNHVRRLVVVKGEHMVGIVTERRLLLVFASQ